MSDNPEAVRCQDGCGRSVPSAKEADIRGWVLLTISNRWRCEACIQLLSDVNLTLAEINRKSANT